MLVHDTVLVVCGKCKVLYCHHCFPAGCPECGSRGRTGQVVTDNIGHTNKEKAKFLKRDKGVKA